MPESNLRPFEELRFIIGPSVSHPLAINYCFISPLNSGTAKKVKNAENITRIAYSPKTPVTHVQVKGLLIKVRELHKAFAAKK